MTSYPAIRAARTATSAIRALLAVAAATTVVAASGCATDTSLRADDPQGNFAVEVRGVVVSDQGDPIADASICSLYSPTSECARTDENGAFSMSALSSPTPDETARPMVAFLVDAEGYYPSVQPAPVRFSGGEPRPMFPSLKMVSNDRMAKQEATARMNFRDDRGHIAFEITRSESESTARVWKGLIAKEAGGTGDRTYYADNDTNLDRTLKATTDNGGFVIPNVEPGMVDVQIHSPSASVRCAAVEGFGSDGGNRFHVDTVPGRVTVVRAVCYEAEPAPTFDAPAPSIESEPVAPRMTNETHPGDGPRFGPAIERPRDLPGMALPPTHEPHPA